MKYLGSFSALLFMFFQANVSAQESSAILGHVTNPNQQQSVEKAIERIEVYGQRPLSFFKRALRNSEEDFFSLYNSLTNDDDFKVSCEDKVYVGRKTKTRICAPAFQNRILFEARQDARLRGSRRNLFNNLTNISRAEIKESMLERQKDHIADMNKLAQQNPELLAKLEEWNAAQISYAVHHYKTFGDASGFADVVQKVEEE